MPRNAVLKSYSTQQCKQSCDNQRNRCLMGPGTDPDPSNAYYIRQCYNAHNQCVTNCTTNNIRPGR